MDAPRSSAEWERVSQRPDFQRLARRKAKFIVVATIFFVIYYFSFLVLVGYFPGIMKRRVWGAMNWAYVFALSQFFMAWILASIYVRAAARWDEDGAAIVADLEGPRKS